MFITWTAPIQNLKKVDNPSPGGTTIKAMTDNNNFYLICVHGSASQAYCQWAPFHRNIDYVAFLIERFGHIMGKNW